MSEKFSREIVALKRVRDGRNSCFIMLLLLLLSGCGITRKATLPQFSEQPFVREFSRCPPYRMDSLKEIYGNNKIFVPEFIEPALIALSYFPELKNTHIEFRYSNEKTTMAARPAPVSLLGIGTRKYRILINRQPGVDGIPLETVPFNAQIGLFAHELAHLFDYQNRNIWGIMEVGFRFLDSKRKTLFEKETDRMTIERGLGWQLYDWAMFAMYTNSTATERYKNFKRRNYLTPEEIEKLIAHYAKYAITFRDNEKER